MTTMTTMTTSSPNPMSDCWYKLTGGLSRRTAWFTRLCKCAAFILSLFNTTAHSGTPLEVPVLSNFATEANGTIPDYGGLSMGGNNTQVCSLKDLNGVVTKIFVAYITKATSISPCDAKLVVMGINVNTGSVAKFTIKSPNNPNVDYRIANDPAHVGPSLGIDRAGFLHLAANMHHHGWQYWRSKYAMTNSSITSGFDWKGCTLVPGITEPNVNGVPSTTSPPGYMISYPTFANDMHGRLYVAYRQRVASGGWFAGCQAGGLAEYNEGAQGTWTAIGGTNYDIPINPTTQVPYPAMGGTKQKAFIYSKLTGPAGSLGYQGYIFKIAFDSWNRMHIVTGLWESGGGNQANGPFRVVSMRANPQGTGSAGFMNYTFMACNNTAISSLPAIASTLVNQPASPMWVVHTRAPASKLSWTQNVGLFFDATHPAPVVQYTETVGTTTKTRWSRYSATGSGGWTLVPEGKLGTSAHPCFGQGVEGAKMFTSTTTFSNQTTVYRTNDNGATYRSYTLSSGATTGKALKIVDSRYAQDGMYDTTSQKLLILELDYNPSFNGEAMDGTKARLRLLTFN